MKACRIEDVEKILATAGHQVVDVREPAEYRSERIAGVLSAPLSALRAESLAALKKNEPVYLVCRSGARACKAAGQMEKFGFTDLRVLEGGLQAWAQAGKPVEKSSSGVWGLERQVRFTAGLLVVTGIVLGWKINPGWFGLSAFVGAGLVFSALTNTCGMAMILARMPWNQGRARS